MGCFIPVPYKPIPPGATKEERQELYRDHMRRLALANPHLYHEDGRERGFWGGLRYLFRRSK